MLHPFGAVQIVRFTLSHDESYCPNLRLTIVNCVQRVVNANYLDSLLSQRAGRPP